MMPNFRPSLRMMIYAALAGGTPLAMGADGTALAPLVVSALGFALTYAAHMAFRIRAARKRARAVIEEARGKELLADGDPSNDAQARELLAAAAEDRAEADVLEDAATKPRL